MTPFQSECYKALEKVPPGKVISYAGLAEMIGRPKAHRAVGSAMNKNPFAPKVPCHRVVKSNGEIGGFADEMVKSIFLLPSNIVDSVNNFFAFIKKDLVIIIQSSLLKLFSFKMPIIFFLFLARQLSTSSDML